jgi:hypothetical protein
MAGVLDKKIYQATVPALAFSAHSLANNVCSS